MFLWVLNENFERLGIVTTASSIIWTDRFRQCGDFEIYVTASAEMMELLQEDRLVAREDSDMVGIIERVQVNTDEENGDFMTVSGRCLRSILDRRIIWEQTVINGTAENGLRRLVNDAFISPAIPERKYDKLTLAAAHGYTDKVQAQYTGTNLLTAMEELCASKNYGFKITLQDGHMVLDFYKGTDRTAGQRDNPRVVFSEEYGNLTATEYARDKTAYKSVCLVAGEGEGTARRRATVTRTVDTSGLHRREMYVDARDISSNEGEITDEEYMAQLADRGGTDLSAAAWVESAAGTIEPYLQHIYGEDYTMGDMVTVINKYGLQVDSQVLEVIEKWDEAGYTCIPTFG